MQTANSHTEYPAGMQRDLGILADDLFKLLPVQGQKPGGLFYPYGGGSAITGKERHFTEVFAVADAVQLDFVSRVAVLDHGHVAMEKKDVKAPEDYPKAPGAEKRDNPPGDMGGHV